MRSLHSGEKSQPFGKLVQSEPQRRPLLIAVAAVTGDLDFPKRPFMTQLRINFMALATTVAMPSLFGESDNFRPPAIATVLEYKFRFRRAERTGLPFHCRAQHFHGKF